MIHADTPDAGDVFLAGGARVREHRRLAAQQCLACALHAVTELVAMTFDVLVHGALDALSLLEPGQQGRVADLLLRGLVDSDLGACTCHRVRRDRA